MASLPSELGSSTKDLITRYYQMASMVLRKLQERNIQHTPPRTGPMFTISQAAALVGRSASAIRIAEAEGRLPHQERNMAGRRKGYTLRDLDTMRQVFDTRPWRQEGDPPAVIACQNFKGGVGKSTIAVHMAQYLAIHGYRVLLVDADAQASATMQFGYIPDQDLDEFDSIYALLQGKPERGIAQIVRKTHFHNLDLIPANLKLYNAEYEVAARISVHGFSVLTTLARDIHKIADNYDVIIMDPPPALGMVSLSVMYAANALLIPVPPSIVDFASTTAFLSMLDETMGALNEHNIQPEYGFVGMVISKSDANIESQRQIVDITNTVFGRSVFAQELKTSAEFNNAASQLKTVFDMTSSTTNHAVRTRCLNQLNNLGRELEQNIRKLWPSKADEI
ncbi:chromosome partitioning protein [Novosphingobium sp. PhB57]|jgi:chromosome partitioning protein|uniref:AAA family ATPase n=1 Tax=Novosphingobium sp. PhB57 TaxID=2485107 RepID=UPI0010EAD460|nr:AAA family ATPase [Novosphingobium sp. PhB57]TCU49298.1 chromosome partitioning protein [Novosphingobium sp. PhB57]